MSPKEQLRELIKQYYFKNELSEFKTAQSFLYHMEMHPDFFENKDAQVVASSFIVNETKTKTLLMYHKKLNKWVQLGGHVEAGETIIEASKREAFEESGLCSLKLISNDIFDLDIHKFGDNHTHYDVRFLFIASEYEALKESDESNGLKWINLTDLKTYTVDEGILRMVQKL